MVRILGGGPAGAAAAITALSEGAEVELYEQSRTPRHKVCGEFLSPAARTLLERLGVLEDCRRAGPARIARFEVHIGRTAKRAALPEPAWGLSRYQLDRILLERAAALGARIIRERRAEADADVVACGRPGLRSTRRNPRLFGFKAHFRGPSGDSTALYFFHLGYVGVNSIENGLTNVCGLVREELLDEHGFEPDRLLAARPGLAERMGPLSRVMDWLFAGPVAVTEELGMHASGPYLAGDRFCFLDPFTGSGITAALAGGSLAGRAAARGIPPAQYYRAAERVLTRPYLFGGAISAAIDTGWGSILAPVVPAAWLFLLTRPRVLHRGTPGLEPSYPCL